VDGVAQTAKRLVERRPGHPVISVYLDLDPERFATAAARGTQIRSLIDEAARDVDRAEGLGHADRTALREDLQRIDAFLSSREPPFRGARALAVFCSGRDGLFETVQLHGAAPARVVIEPTPYIEPLVAAMREPHWCVVLVSRRSARLLSGPVSDLRERRRIDDDTHGQHDQGGWSQANYERSIEKDTDDHLRRAADLVRRVWRAERFDRLAIGGPPEIVPRFEAFLGDEVRTRVAPGRVEVDAGGATEEQVRVGMAKLAEDDDRRIERAALDRLAAGIGSDGRATGGPDDTIEALNERRVATLLLEPAFEGHAMRCSSCGLLSLGGDRRCPADGTEMEEVDHLREAVVEAALAQDADVMIVRYYPDLGPFQGIGALLRF
jgi:peptide chain release factor subunit 1